MLRLSFFMSKSFHSLMLTCSNSCFIGESKNHEGYTRVTVVGVIVIIIVHTTKLLLNVVCIRLFLYLGRLINQHFNK